MNSQINYHPVGEALQDIAYEYDLVGNITAIHDRSSKCGVADNLPLGEDALDRLFNYDPLYRLVSATGRECRDIPHSRPWLDEPRCGFNAGHAGVPNQDNAPHLTALYREDYAYDPAGNLVMLQHQQAVRSNGGLSWETIETRRFGMGGLTPEQWQEAWPRHLSGDWLDSPGNRLTHLEDRWAGVASPLTVPQTHFFDDNGNLIRENQSRHFEWDYADRLRSFRTQAGDSEPSIHAHYLYDSAGQRVKKLVRKQGGQLAVTVYIDGLFEYQCLVQGGTTHQNNTLHVMDDQSRVATVRVGEPFPDDTAPAVKYHLGDHLGSSNLVINSSGKWINREEYTPYGETSFGSFARKRYRFSGKERDEESGLYYYGARYYSPWLAKWLNCDPAGIADGLNLYQYVRDNSLNTIDPSGRQSSQRNLIPGGVSASGEPQYEYEYKTPPVEKPPILLDEVKIVGVVPHSTEETIANAVKDIMTKYPSKSPAIWATPEVVNLTGKEKKLEPIPSQAQLEIRLMLEKSYPEIFPPKNYYIDVNKYQPILIEQKPINFTGVFVLVGKETKMPVVPLFLGTYGLFGYSHEHGIYGGFIKEHGLSLGLVDVSLGVETGLAYSEEKKGLHPFAYSLGFAQIGHNFGVGMAWDISKEGIIPYINKKEGEFSPYIFGEFGDWTIGLGVDASYRY